MNSSIQNIIQKKLDDHLFTACGVGFQIFGKPAQFITMGTESSNKSSKKISTTTLFDLASITKVMFTTTVAADLFQQKKLILDIPIVKHPGLEDLQKFIHYSQYANCTLEDLLLHRAGFPGTVQYSDFHSLKSEKSNPTVFSKRLIEFTTSIEPVYDLEKKIVYSDPGFIYLAELLSILAGKTTHVLWQDLQEKFQLSGCKDLLQITEDDSLAATGSDLQRGVPQDAQARHIGRLCGHAGLFADISTVMSFGNLWLESYHQGRADLEQNTVKRFIDPYYHEVPGERYLGWDGVSENSTAGDISQKSIGHLGYTGTSLWIDLEKKLVVSILTNRTLTHLEKSSDLLTRDQILEFNDFRRAIHNEIWRICSL